MANQWPPTSADSTPVDTDAIPYAPTYEHPDTGGIVEVTSGPDFDICKHTPYGVMTESTAAAAGSDIADAIQWAIRWQREPNPDARDPVGGPRGCFRPYIGGNDWFVTGTGPRWWRITKPIELPPNIFGGYLGGLGKGDGQVQGNQGLLSRIYVDFDDEVYDSSVPAIFNNSRDWTLENFALMERRAGQTKDRREVGILNHKIASTSDPWYVSGITTVSNTPCSDTNFLNLAIAGFDVGIRSGGTQSVGNVDFMTVDNVDFRDTLIGWHNANDQGLVHSFSRIKQAEDATFYFEYGGKSEFRNIDILKPNTTLLRIGYGPGKNNSDFKLYNITQDNNAGADTYWVEMIQSDGATFKGYSRQGFISVFGGSNSRTLTSGWPNRFMKLVGDTQLNLYGVKGLGPIEGVGGDPGSTYAGKSNKPSIYVSGGQILSRSDAYFRDNLVTGDYHTLSIQGCTINDTSDPVSQPQGLVERPTKVNDIPVTANITVPVIGGRSTVDVPKVNQPSTQSYNILGTLTQRKLTISDLTHVRVVLQARYKDSAANAVFDKNSEDDSAFVTTPDSDGDFDVHFTDADFGEDLLQPGVNYYVVIMAKVAISGSDFYIEYNERVRLKFKYDQSDASAS